MSQSCFSLGQALAIIGMFVAAAACVIGAGAPYWVVADGSEYGLATKVASYSMGLFQECPTFAGEKKCDMIPFDINDVDGSTAWFLAVRLCAITCAFLGAISGMVALIQCCCSRGSLFGIGVLCFLAAGIGAAAPAIFATKLDGDLYASTAMKYELLKYGWAFFVFCGGCGLLAVVSVLACCVRSEYRPVAVV